MRHSYRIQAQNQAKHMEYILQIANQITPRLVLHHLLLRVQSVKLLQIFHPFFLRFVGEYNVSSFELPPLDPALRLVLSILVFLAIIEHFVKQDTNEDSVVPGEGRGNVFVECRGAFQEMVLLVLEKLFGLGKLLRLMHVLECQW